MKRALLTFQVSETVGGTFGCMRLNRGPFAIKTKVERPLAKRPNDQWNIRGTLVGTKEKVCWRMLDIIGKP